MLAKNDHQTLVYQDAVLKQAAWLASPGSTVLDGCGWLLDSKPAQRFWFLPRLTNVLNLPDWGTPNAAQHVEHDPPALVIADKRLASFLTDHPDLSLVVTTNYLPVTPNLWVPGLSRALSASARRWTWNVLKDGVYRILSSAALARHPWFASPLAIVTGPSGHLDTLRINPASFDNRGLDQILWKVDGMPVTVQSGQLTLSRGQSLDAEFTGTGAIGVMLVPERTGPLFAPSPPGISLDYFTATRYWTH